MMVSDEIQEAIKDTAHDRFSGAQIVSVNVTSAEDSEGDPILKIYVVYDTSDGESTLDGNKMAGLARHVMGRLSKMDFAGFPLISFISRKDAAKFNLEAA